MKTKKSLDTNSNAYTIIYASVLVIIVALMLAFTSSSLKSKQLTNIELDRKKQILSSIAVSTDGQDASALYDQYITESVITNINAEILSTDKDETFAVNVAEENGKKDASTRRLPIYIATVNGETKYVFPVRGAGLWGPIWGYVALNADKNTVFGVYYSHASETPGLGADIVQDKFKSQFPGKKMFNAANEFVSIAVMKAGQIAANQDQVDAIAGGTITSKGLEAMLLNSIGQYEKYLTTNAEEVQE